METSYEFESAHIMVTALGVVIVIGIILTPADEMYFVVKGVVEGVYYYISMKAIA